jgi:hypothetical protein
MAIGGNGFVRPIVGASARDMLDRRPNEAGSVLSNSLAKETPAPDICVQGVPVELKYSRNSKDVITSALAGVTSGFQTVARLAIKCPRYTSPTLAFNEEHAKGDAD